MGIAYTLIKDFRVRNPFIFFTAVAALDRASEGLSTTTEIAENRHGIDPQNEKWENRVSEEH